MARFTTRTGKVLAAIGLAGITAASVLTTANASSHREAPLITEDPVADNTDVYAFNTGDSVTLISNWIPLEEPASGPNFNRFGDDVLYEINVDNNGDAIDDVTYEFRFRTQVQSGDTFLYNTGPITVDTNTPTSTTYKNLNVVQTYTVTEVRNGVRRVLGTDLPTPPVNIGPRSTPDYETLASAAIKTVDGDIKVFAGQRDEAFEVDLGSVFDLLGLRPLNDAHAIKQPPTGGVNATTGYNVHSIAIQVPKAKLTTGGDPVIGVYSTTYRRKARVFSGNDGARLTHNGPWVQVSRLGNPLVNEVVIPLKDKDRFNASKPQDDAQFLKYVQDPEPGRLIPKLYPVFSCFPTAPRNDLVAVFLTGLPGLNQPKNVKPSEMLRLNTSMPAGFPNGRTLDDDVVDTELVAIAGAALPSQQCAGKSPNKDLTDGVSAHDRPDLASFPYIATPWQGYAHEHKHS